MGTNSFMPTDVDSRPGMFLWVRLVLSSLEHACSIHELGAAVNAFPNELARVYGRILELIRFRLRREDYDRVLRILGWIAFAKRPLRVYELQYAAILHLDTTVIDYETKPFDNTLDISKPLAEIGRNQTVMFIHSSVKEYAQ